MHCVKVIYYSKWSGGGQLRTLKDLLSLTKKQEREGPHTHGTLFNVYLSYFALIGRKIAAPQQLKSGLSAGCEGEVCHYRFCQCTSFPIWGALHFFNVLLGLLSLQFASVHKTVISWQAVFVILLKDKICIKVVEHIYSSVFFCSCCFTEVW